MAEIAQAYFHFRTHFSKRRLRRFGHQIDRVAREAAIRNFESTVLINVEIEEGSIIGRVTAIATILTVYTGMISDYKGVKDSLAEMCEDARSFGADVCGKAVKLSGINKKQIYRLEKRTKTVGKLSRLLKDVERLENSTTDLSPAQMQKELGRLNHELQAIAEDLQPEEQQILGRILERTDLPAPERWPQAQIEPPKVALKEEQYELTYEQISKQEDQSKPRRMRYRNSFKVQVKGQVHHDPLLIPKR
jgi:hypothetical protein